MSITLETHARIATLKIDRPEAGNRLDRRTLSEIADVLGDLAGTADVSVLVLGSTGEDFSLGREPDQVPKTSPAEIAEQFTQIQCVNEQLEHLPLVTIAAIRGRAVGAGLSLAARCDIVVVADNARLSLPEVTHGIPPTIVLSRYRYTLPRNILGDLIFTGRELSGDEAVRFGFAARAVDAATVDEVAGAIATQVSGYDPSTLTLVKDFLNRTENLSPRDAPALGIALYAVEMASRQLRQE